MSERDGDRQIHPESAYGLLSSVNGSPGSSASPQEFRDPRGRSGQPMMRLLIMFAVFALLLGAVSGIIWNKAVTLPGYTVGHDGGASTNERGLSEFIAADAGFAICALIGGLLTGLLAWVWFRRLGWAAVIIALVGATLAGVCCWLMGLSLGPSDFNTRLTEAAPGQFVPIDFELNALSALALWPFFASLVTLIGSLLPLDNKRSGLRRVPRLPSRNRVPSDAS